MKKIAALIIWGICSGLVHAWGETCMIYKVRIKNIGSMDCVLKKHYILYGELSKQSNIPEVIFRNEEVQFEMTAPKLDPFLEAAALLTYECGDDRDITFFTTTSAQSSPMDRLYHYSSKSAVLESKNIEASFKATQCNKIYANPYEITWTLNP